METSDAVVNHGLFPTRTHARHVISAHKGFSDWNKHLRHVNEAMYGRQQHIY
jgi:hypothetical protein